MVFLAITRRTRRTGERCDGRLARGEAGSSVATSALVFAFLYLPLMLIVLYAFNKTTINSWPFPGFSTRWFDKLAHDAVPKDAAWLSVQDRDDLDRARAAARHAMAFAFARFRFRGRELDQLRGHAADHPARRDHRRRAGVVLPVHRDGPLDAHGDRRPHDVLHRARLQQRARAAAAAVAFAGGGIAGSRRERLADLPATSPCRRSARRWSRARCCRSRSPSTRSRSRSSSPARTRTTLPLWILGAFRNSQNVPEVNAAATVILRDLAADDRARGVLMREEGGAQLAR